jgi:hypothetical protein
MGKDACSKVESGAVDVTCADKQPHCMTRIVRSDGQACCKKTKRPEDTLDLVS